MVYSTSVPLHLLSGHHDVWPGHASVIFCVDRTGHCARNWGWGIMCRVVMFCTGWFMG